MSGYTNCTVRSAQRTYQLVEEISGGGFGVGYRAIDVRTAGSPEGPTVYFFKVLREATSAVALRELNVARRHAALPRHVFVVRVVDTLEQAAVAVPRGSPALPPVTAIVQEMCNGGDLFTRLALVPNKERGSGVKQVAFDERFARYFCRQLIVGVNHLHSHNMCAHRASPRLAPYRRPRGHKRDPNQTCAVTRRAQLPPGSQAGQRTPLELHDGRPDHRLRHQQARRRQFQRRAAARHGDAARGGHAGLPPA
jgi:hypothetical protein